MPLISILLPFYNSEKFIASSIKSILKQSFTAFELICIDDGSIDNSLAIVKNLKKKDKRIEILHQLQNKGVAPSLNRGIKAAKGEYIARMDADDIAFPHRLSTQKAYLDTHPDIQLVGSQVMGINQYGKKLKLPINLATQQNALIFISLFTAPFTHPSIMARAEVFKSFPYSESTEHEYMEDYELWQRMLFAGVKATNITEPLLAYRLHGKSITINKKGQNKANLFCITSLAKHLGIRLNEPQVAAVRGKTNFSIDEVVALYKKIEEHFFSMYPCSSSEKNEISKFEARILNEVAFKNFKTGELDKQLKSILLLMAAPDRRQYLTSRIYNYLINTISH